MKLKLYALALGLFCHLSFGLAIVLMAVELFNGFTFGVFPIGQHVGWQVGRWCNILLLIQFPVLHSLLLSARGTKLMTRLPKQGGRDLVTTTFATISSLQLLAVFALWTPAERVWFAPHGYLLVIWSFVYLGSWIFLARAIWDASLPLHSGSLGWQAVVRGRSPRYPTFATHGLYRFCRQPIYLAFALIILSGPVWTIDHLLCVLLWCSYCFLGPVLKERRFVQRFGERFVSYQKEVPFMVPTVMRLWPGRRR